MRAARPVGFLAVLALALAGACGEGSTSFVSDPDLEARTRSLPAPGGAPALARQDLLREIAHSGVRRVDVWTHGDVPTHLAYRERVTTGGRGEFSIEPLEPVGGVAEWNTFELLQRARAGFVFRYRDFAVRDAELAARNWTWTNLDQEHRVAGRRCERYRVERTSAPRTAYEVSIDAELGLVLAYREFDAAGREVSAVAYESLDLAPDLGGAVWHALRPEEALDHRRELTSQVALEVLVPRLSPRGYELRSATTFEDGDGRRWLKLTYLDGIEPLFFLQLLAESGQGASAGVTWTAGGEIPAPGASAIEPGSITVFSIGRATVLQGSLGGRRVTVVGKAGEVELLDFLESSLP